MTQYTKRIQTICNHLQPCKYFADIGCDHGYCTEFMLKNKMCSFAMIADISANSLKKAEKLLAEYLQSGQLKSICTNGLQSIEKIYEQILIAGMGGEEIIQILQNGYLPSILVLQPMKNTEKVRQFLLAQNYCILKDFTFFDKKFYDLLVAKQETKSNLLKVYSALDIKYGYDNLHTPQQDFLDKIILEIAKYENRRKCFAVEEKLKELYEVAHEIKGHFSNH